MKLTVAEIQSIITEKIPSGLVVADHNESGHAYVYTPTGERIRSVTTKGGVLDMPHLKKWAAKEAVKYIDENFSKLTRENKDQIFKAAIFAHQDQFEEAGDVGTAGHNIIEKYLGQWIVDFTQPKDITDFIEGLEKADRRLVAIARSCELFCNDYDIEPISTELLVAWPKDGIAGTLDALAMVGLPVKLPESPFLGSICGSKHNYRVTSNSRRLYECHTCGKVVKKRFALVDWKTSNSIDKPDYAMQVSAYSRAFFKLTGLKPEVNLIVRLDKGQAKYEVMQVAHPPSALRAWKHASRISDWLEDCKKSQPLVPIVPKEKTKIDYSVIG